MARSRTSPRQRRVDGFSVQWRRAGPSHPCGARARSRLPRDGTCGCCCRIRPRQCCARRATRASRARARSTESPRLIACHVPACRIAPSDVARLAPPPGRWCQHPTRSSRLVIRSRVSAGSTAADPSRGSVHARATRRHWRRDKRLRTDGRLALGDAPAPRARTRYTSDGFPAPPHVDRANGNWRERRAGNRDPR